MQLCCYVAVKCATSGNLESYSVKKGSSQKEAPFGQIVGHSGLLNHLRPAKHRDSMYQWCKARRTKPHERECPENAELATLEYRADHDYDGKRTENSSLPDKVTVRYEI